MHKEKVNLVVFVLWRETGWKFLSLSIVICVMHMEGHGGISMHRGRRGYG